MVFEGLPDSIGTELDRLRSDWETVPIGKQRYLSPADEYDPETDDVFRYASAWVRRDGEVLLVRPVEDDGWASPGGVHEDGETHEETAIRETREETGLEVELEGVLEAIVTRHEFGNEATEWALGVVFDARPVGGDLELQEEEIDDARWFDEIPAPDELVFERTADYPL